MFKKSPSSLGPSAPIRSSDRRKLMAAIGQQYPELSGPAGAATAGGQGGQETLKALCPDGLRMGNVRTSADIDGVLYSDPNGNPLWITFSHKSSASKVYLPTLYTIDLHLRLPSSPRPFLPLLQVHNPPPPPFLAGAPLFIPAVKHLFEPHLLPALKSEMPVLFVTAVSPSPLSQDPTKEPMVALGIGRFASQYGSLETHLEKWLQTKDLVRKGGQSGKGMALEETEVGRMCETVTMVGDSLWDLGSKPHLPAFEYGRPEQPISAGPASPSSISGGDITSPDALKPPPLNTLSIEDDVSTTRMALNPGEVDRLLTLSLYQSLPLIQASALPIPSSTLYSAYILPNRPASIPKAQRDEVVIAKSSWKKVGKWMKVLGEGKGGVGLMKTKEAKDGSHTILSINQTHDLLQTHKPHRTVAQEAAREAKDGSALPEQGSTTGTSSNAVSFNPGSGLKGKSKEIQVEEYWRPANHGLEFWEDNGYDRNAHLTHQQILDTFNKYIADHALANMRERANVILDEPLGRACGLFKNKKAGAVEERVSMRKDQIVTGLKGEMIASVRIGGESGSFKKGTLQPVHLSVKSRGKKTVTLIRGVEVFGIAPEDLAEELKRVCAGSASVDPLSGAPVKSGLMEIMVQGSQLKAVTDALVARGIARRWIKEEGSGGKSKHG